MVRINLILFALLQLSQMIEGFFFRNKAVTLSLRILQIGQCGWNRIKSEPIQDKRRGVTR